MSQQPVSLTIGETDRLGPELSVGCFPAAVAASALKPVMDSDCASCETRQSGGCPNWTEAGEAKGSGFSGTTP